MKIDLKSELTILNIFKGETEFLEGFIEHHASNYAKVVMLGTGDVDGYDYAKEVARRFDNVEVYFQQFIDVDFSAFRNACLNIFNIQKYKTSYYCWVDTDELLECSNSVIYPESSNVFRIAREDGSKRFITLLDRMFHSDTSGTWEKPVHEHFYIRCPHTINIIQDLRINHLTSEVHRDPTKKQLYYQLLLKQLRESKVDNNRQIVIDALQHLILMSSHDFKDPKSCVELFDEHRHLIISSNSDFEISKVQKLNIFIHYTMSLSRLGLPIDNEIFLLALKLNCAQTTVFQLLRALVFNVANHEMIKKYYEVNYQQLPPESNKDFNNKDYLNPESVQWFENKLYKD